MPSDPVLVVGVCAPERRRYARELAEATGRGYEQWGTEPGDEHPRIVHLAHDEAGTRRVVADVATDAALAHLEPALREPAVAIVCVVDARHMLDDLHDDAPLAERAAAGDDRGDVGARARQAVAFLEASTSICFVGWESVETARLALLMSIAAHLSPHARVRLSRGAVEDAAAVASSTPHPSLLERAGWVAALNGEHDPYLTDRRVRTVRYERLRAFHPARLARALDEIESGRHGIVLRSAGFCRLATRARTLARWDHVGSAMWIDPLTTRADAAGTGQDLVLTGIDLDVGAVVDALDLALLTDAEFTLGPDHWRRLADPLPTWPPLGEDAARDA